MCSYQWDFICPCKSVMVVTPIRGGDPIHERFASLLAGARPFENLFANLQAPGLSRPGPNLFAHRPNSKSGPGRKAAEHACERRRRGLRAREQPKWSRKRLSQAASGQCPRARMSADDTQRRGRRRPATRREQPSPAASRPRPAHVWMRQTLRCRPGCNQHRIASLVTLRRS